MSHSTFRHWGLGIAALALLGSVYACGANTDEPVFVPDAKGGSAGAAGNVSDGGKLDASAGSAGSTSQGGTGGGTILLDSALGDQAMNADTACVSTHVEAEPIPLDLYFMVDKSGSMSGSPWVDQTEALKSFFSDAQSDGLYVALNFFPKDNSETSPSCDGTLFKAPKVDWGLLPAHYPALKGVIDSTSPTGTTPTQDALNGALKAAKDRQKQMLNHVVAVVIVSDGEPCCGDCPEEEASGIGDIAEQYAKGTPPIKTFAIYVDDSASAVMTAIATNGGTKQPYDATGGKQAFIDALESIKSVALACEYKIPEADGGKVNPALVDVAFTPGADAGPSVPIYKVANQAACAGGPGWYYDNETNPTKITLCDASCTAAKTDPNGRVDILLGCTTQTR